MPFDPFPLHIPYKEWGKEATFSGSKELANYLAIERWAGELAEYTRGLKAKPYDTFVVAASDSVAPGAAGADFICDGTNDHEEIQKAVDAATASGGEVLLLEGTFYTGGKVTIPDGVSIRGVPGAVVFPQNNTDTFSILGEGVTISGIYFYGDPSSEFITVGSLAKNSKYLRVENCTFHGTGDVTIYLYVYKADFASVINCVFKQAAGTVSGGMLVSNALQTKIIGCSFEQLTTSRGVPGIQMADGSEYSSVSGCTLKNCFISLIGGLYTTVSANTVWLSSGAMESGILVETDNIVVVGNTVQETSGSFTQGIYLNAVDDCVVSSNMIVCFSIGVSLRHFGSCDYNLIIGNRIPFSTTGIAIGQNALKTYVLDNHLVGCATRISDAGISTYTGKLRAKEFYYAVDDCLSNVSSKDFSWTVAGTGAAFSSLVGETNHYGITRFSTGTTATGRASVQSQQANFIVFNATQWHYEALLRIPTLSDGTNRFVVRAGFMDVVNGDAIDGAYFRYSDNVNGGKWECVVRNNSSEVVSDSGVPVSAGVWYRLRVLVGGSTSALFFIDDVQKANVTGLSATRETGVGVHITKTVGTTARTIEVDYIECEGSEFTR